MKNKKSLISTEKFYWLAKSKGVHVTRIDGGVITIAKQFKVSDRDQLLAAEQACFEVMSAAPISRPGSTWGTTSDGVGAWAALQTGYMRLSRSGLNMRWLSKLHQTLLEISEQDLDPTEGFGAYKACDLY